MQNTSEGAENRVYVHRYSPLQETLGEGFSGYCGVLVVLTREEEEEESVFVFCL